MAGLVGDMVDDAALARVIRKEVLAKRRRSIRAAFKRGLERGEIRRSIDLDVAIDMLTAPFYFRVLVWARRDIGDDDRTRCRYAVARHEVDQSYHTCKRLQTMAGLETHRQHHLSGRTDI